MSRAGASLSRAHTTTRQNGISTRNSSSKTCPVRKKISPQEHQTAAPAAVINESNLPELSRTPSPLSLTLVSSLPSNNQTAFELRNPLTKYEAASITAEKQKETRLASLSTVAPIASTQKTSDPAYQPRPKHEDRNEARNPLLPFEGLPILRLAVVFARLAARAMEKHPCVAGRP